MLSESDEFDATLEPGEDRRAFRIRLGQLAREARDTPKEGLRERYAAKLKAPEKRRATAKDVIDRESA